MLRGRVLVVDDEPHVAEFLRDALTHFDFEVCQPTRGEASRRPAKTFGRRASCRRLGLILKSVRQDDCTPCAFAQRPRDIELGESEACRVLRPPGKELLRDMKDHHRIALLDAPPSAVPFRVEIVHDGRAGELRLQVLIYDRAMVVHRGRSLHLLGLVHEQRARSGGYWDQRDVIRPGARLQSVE
jgi:hypothetical protein